MSYSINIGSLNSGNTIVGGTGGTITGSGVVNVYGDQLLQLRTLLDDLIRAIEASGAQPEARDAAELARVEAAKPSPEPGRLRKLVETVINAAGGAVTVTQAALNVMGVITMIENAVR